MATSTAPDSPTRTAWLTLADASRLLDNLVGPKTIYAWTVRGIDGITLPYRVVGTRRYVERDVLLRYASGDRS